MAKKQERKPRQKKVYADEQAITNKIDALLKKIGDNDPTEAQSTELKNLRAELGGLKFVRLAQTRVGKAVKLIRNIGKLGTPAYKRTPEQVKWVVDLLKAEVAEVEKNLAASKTKAADTAFVMPKAQAA